MHKIAYPAAGVFGLFTLLAFVQWLNGGVEYIGDTRVVASAPGAAAIACGIAGAFFLFLGWATQKIAQAERKAELEIIDHCGNPR